MHTSLPHPPLPLWHGYDTPQFLHIWVHPCHPVLPEALFTETEVVFLKQNVSYPAVNLQVKIRCIKLMINKNKKIHKDSGLLPFW